MLSWCTLWRGSDERLWFDAPLFCRASMTNSQQRYLGFGRLYLFPVLPSAPLLARQSDNLLALPIIASISSLGFSLMVAVATAEDSS